MLCSNAQKIAMSEMMKDHISETDKVTDSIVCIFTESLLISIKDTHVCHLLIRLHCFGCDTDKFTLNIYPQAFDSHKLVDTVNDVTITS